MLALAACTPRSNTVSPGVSPELKHSWEVYFNRGNANGVAALYAPDAQLVMTGQPPIRGIKAIRSAIEDMIKGGVRVRISSEKNVSAGDIAYVYGSYVVLQGDNGPEAERGAYVEVWRHIDGVWKIELDVNTKT